jgi:uncharacterized repeat protein (TIGR03803 family)
MKTHIIHPFLVPTLIAVLNLLPVGQAPAQTFTTLHSFTAGAPYYIGDEIVVGLANSDGLYPNSLILSGNTLYGTAGLGGGQASGALFALSTDGTGFTNLHDFAVRDLHGSYTPETNPDGINPNSLILSGNILYGTAEKGGQGFDNGALFAVNTDGTGFTNLHNFTVSCCFVGVSNWDGAHPESRMLLSGDTLYGSAAAAGSSNSGTLFALNIKSRVFTLVHSFTAAHANSSGVSTNRDGANPYAGLILSATTLYGTASACGTGGAGTVFALNTNGTGFTNLHNFTAVHTNSSGVSTNSDGASPRAVLLLSGSTLYGTASSGGAGGGTVFAVNTNGTGFRVLHSFTATHTNSSGISTNGDGANPYAELILSGDTLYGTASSGGTGGAGTVFAVNTNGTGFINLHNFTATSSPGTNTDGAGPLSALVLSGSTLYGTAQRGGSAGSGTVFSLSFAPQLTLTRFGTNVILSWPTSVAGFDYTGYSLQSAPASTGPFTDLPGVTSSHTNPIAAAQFFRLKK